MKKFVIIVIAIVAVALFVRLNQSSADTPLPEKEAPTPLGVYVATVDKGTLRDRLYDMGTARAAQREFLAFETSGKVTGIAKIDGEWLRPGDAVKTGQELARIDDSDQQAAVANANAGLAEAKQQHKVALASLEQANARLDLANKRLAREKDLFSGGAASAEAVEQATTDQIEVALAKKVAQAQEEAAKSGILAMQTKVTQAKRDLERCRIVSPIDGIIAHMNLKVGWQFSPQSVRTDSEQSALRTIPFVVITPTAYEVVLDIPDYQIDRLKRGQKAWVGLSKDASEKALGGDTEIKSIEATVHAVSPGVATGGRSVRVTLRTTTRNPALHDGQHVWGAILVSEKTDALVAPMAAVLVEDRRSHVFVVDNGAVKKQAIETGLRSDNAVEVLSGIEPGAQVVTEGKFSLYDGMPVRVLTETSNAN